MIRHASRKLTKDYRKNDSYAFIQDDSLEEIMKNTPLDFLWITYFSILVHLKTQS